MSPFLVRAMSHALRFYGTKEARRFDQALQNPREAQERTWKRIQKNLGAFYAPISGIGNLDDLRVFAAPQSYEDIQPHLSQLVKKSYNRFELTSGSSRRKKIPYPTGLMADFHSMFRLWAWDVLSSFSFKSGRIFMSVSPRTSAELEKKDDSQYLDFVTQILIGRFLVGPRVGRKAPEDFFSALLREMILSQDLEVISVWSPTYMTTLLEIARDEKFQKTLPKPFQHRVQQALQENNWCLVWRQLQLISCWDQGAALVPSAQLKSLFPGVAFQGKGLLATEGPMTIPWQAADSRTLPLLNHVVLEFVDLAGRAFFIDEVSEGETYEILLTTSGGLVRYRIGDLVRIGPKYKNTYSVSFLGRAGQVSDLVGEKLTEQSLLDVLRREIQRLRGGLLISPAPGNEFRYRLDLEVDLVSS
ncbi:MAG: GH3 auxin-responsive promoter family protein, partial [Bdellovibrionales bacterium]|nr:GH3 auxin-responsive promoter family protein [Bdellovibrionales bacterium]